MHLVHTLSAQNGKHAFSDNPDEAHFSTSTKRLDLVYFNFVERTVQRNQNGIQSNHIEQDLYTPTSSNIKHRTIFLEIVYTFISQVSNMK